MPIVVKPRGADPTSQQNMYSVEISERKYEMVHASYDSYKIDLLTELMDILGIAIESL